MISFHEQFPLEGSRCLAFMMLDHDVVAASPSSVYRVLKAAGLRRRWHVKPSKKGTGFVQPLAPHEHWHVDLFEHDLLDGPSMARHALILRCNVRNCRS
jgi:putative transposase